MRKVRKIAQTKPVEVKRKKVAAYARVSSGKDAMLHSLSSQISYYNSYIGSRGDWQLAGIYADEAVTGTKERRPEFQRLLKDCRDGKIELVITKSVTRFARNTVTLLETVRELKALGIDIFFEQENIHTLSADGELMISLLASYAQEESRSASENQKRKIRRMFERGKPSSCNMLGYRLEDGGIVVIPEEAEIVKQIFAYYLSGMGRNAIMKKLNREGVPSKLGRRWCESSVREVLRNEKYMGDLILQKYFIRDFLTKEKAVNRGELRQYYIVDDHEPIIDKETFRQAEQERIRRMSQAGIPASVQKTYIFTRLLHCGICGKYFNRKSANAGTSYAKPAWICPTMKNLGKDCCASRQIPERILIEKTSEFLGTEQWTREDLLDEISEILVPDNTRLVFISHDGARHEVSWQNRSRRESWTKEMREKARRKTLKRLEQEETDGNDG